jgi:hypothetical protein
MDPNLSLPSRHDFHCILLFPLSPSFMRPRRLCSVRIIVVLYQRSRSPHEGETGILPRSFLHSRIFRAPGQLLNRHRHGTLIPMNGKLPIKPLLTNHFRNQVPNCLHLPRARSGKGPKNARAPLNQSSDQKIEYHMGYRRVMILQSDKSNCDLEYPSGKRARKQSPIP